MCRQMTAEGLTKYPEREPVERIVAAHFGLQPEQVLLTNGVDEAIHLMCCAFLDEGDEAMICPPTFFMYDVNMQHDDAGSGEGAGRMRRWSFRLSGLWRRLRSGRS